MPRSVLSGILLLLVSTAAAAQVPKRKSAGQGYVFVGTGAANTEEGLLHFGGGGELNLYKGFGMGVELGYLSPMQSLGDGIGVFSLNAQYTFNQDSANRVKPFLTGGYSLAFRSGTMSALNFGGGVHYWFSDRIGLRLEFRDHVPPEYSKTHLWEGRVGFDFR